MAVHSFVIATALLLTLPYTVAAQKAPSAATTVALPTEIPLFPLPEVSLFPGVQRPFLIFEPRYREMIADALKGDKIIGMVRLRPGFEKDYEGRPPIYTTGCAGRIEKYEQLPDGRYVIVAEHGGRRQTREVDVRSGRNRTVNFVWG